MFRFNWKLGFTIIEMFTLSYLTVVSWAVNIRELKHVQDVIQMYINMGSQNMLNVALRNNVIRHIMKFNTCINNKWHKGLIHKYEMSTTIAKQV